MATMWNVGQGSQGSIRGGAGRFSQQLLRGCWGLSPADTTAERLVIAEPESFLYVLLLAVSCVAFPHS